MSNFYAFLDEKYKIIGSSQGLEQKKEKFLWISLPDREEPLIFLISTFYREKKIFSLAEENIFISKGKVVFADTNEQVDYDINALHQVAIRVARHIGLLMDEDDTNEFFAKLLNNVDKVLFMEFMVPLCAVRHYDKDARQKLLPILFEFHKKCPEFQKLSTTQRRGVLATYFKVTTNTISIDLKALGIKMEEMIKEFNADVAQEVVDKDLFRKSQEMVEQERIRKQKQLEYVEAERKAALEKTRKEAEERMRAKQEEADRKRAAENAEAERQRKEREEQVARQREEARLQREQEQQDIADADLNLYGALANIYIEDDDEVQNVHKRKRDIYEDYEDAVEEEQRNYDKVKTELVSAYNSRLDELKNNKMRRTEEIPALEARLEQHLLAYHSAKEELINYLEKRVSDLSK